MYLEQRQLLTLLLLLLLVGRHESNNSNHMETSEKKKIKGRSPNQCYKIHKVKLMHFIHTWVPWSESIYSYFARNQTSISTFLADWREKQQV